MLGVNLIGCSWRRFRPTYCQLKGGGEMEPIPLSRTKRFDSAINLKINGRVIFQHRMDK